ncbi:MAG: hypothetical protein FJX54_08375 [Alphaproteobacteria bacterium]|nr:hypothetical protein [Alphaproteobacteria bacterium]
MVWTHGTKIVMAVAVLAAGLPVLAAAASWHDGVHEWGHRWGQPRHAAFCAGRAQTRADDRLAAVERRLALRPEQREAWTRLSEAVARATATVKIACAAPASDTPAALARLEAGMEVGLDALRTLRPSLEVLYAQLYPEQRTRLDRVLRGRL